MALRTWPLIVVHAMTNQYGVRMRVRMRSRAYAGAVQVEVKPRRRAIPYHFHIARANGCVSALTKNWEHRLIWRRLYMAAVTGAGRGADGRPTVRVRTCIRRRCI